ncbi:MAG: endo-1,4-beta-xylanase [Planctomycetaceae bacterium]|nr:endo-1,4-beta-xylanase [Planctomycetaceae bacterium]
MKFQVFKNGKPLLDFTLSGAYLFGSDLIPLRHVDKIEFKDGEIECLKKSPDAAGLALLWPIEDTGHLLLLNTTRLPERPLPYNLNLELARARMMQITLKREDWALFDQSDKFEEMAQEVEDLFIKALQYISVPERASVYADQSLRKGVEFSEKLAAKHAEQFLAARFRNKALGRHSLGCEVNLDQMADEKYRKWLLEMFGFITIPINWAQIEPRKGEYYFEKLDQCIQYLAGRRVAICAGPLLKFTPDFMPQWLLQQKPGFEKIREDAYAFITAVVTRFAKSVHAWRVISGINALNCFNFTFEQAMEMTRTACLAARAADNKSRKMVELIYPWGEYYASDKTTVPPLVYVDMVIQSGISFDAFGLQLHFGKDVPGMHVRDMMQISSRLDCFAAVPKAVHITGVSVPDSPGPDVMATERAGCWRKPWDPSIQAAWIEEFYKASLGRPFINTVTYSCLADHPDQPTAGCGLLTKDMTPKKSFLVMAKFQKTILKR